jgi:hypothetical protein
MTARGYLVGRFRADAAALHQRATALGGAAGERRSGGPDAAMSTRMAVACEAVAALVEGIPEGTEAPGALAALIPQLEARAAQAGAGAERAVFAGAATRVREVLAAAAPAPSPPG